MLITRLKVFARKIVRIFGEIDNDLLQNELRVVLKLCKSRENKNIVEVLGDGSLLNSYHYLDMELCDLNLATYITWEWRPTIQETTMPLVNAHERMEQVWNIMKDITNGVAFIHNHNEVHRDLKPHNGKSWCTQTNKQSSVFSQS
jgi:serine/threonine protein kinase